MYHIISYYPRDAVQQNATSGKQNKTEQNKKNKKLDATFTQAADRVRLVAEHHQHNQIYVHKAHPSP